MKEKRLCDLDSRIQSLLQEKSQVDQSCVKCDHRDLCHECFIYKKLKSIKYEIRALKQEIFELEYDVDTWAYTITGNREAQRISNELTNIVLGYATSGEKQRYPDGYPDKFWRKLLERSFDEIVKWVINQNSRLAFQILGEEIMFLGARMPEEIRELILLHSEWEDEQGQLDNKKDQDERKYYLLDFREKIKNYKEGMSINIPRKTKREIFEKHVKNKKGFIIIDRKSIDYRHTRDNN
ncbi:MAG: hypothetical protein ACFFFT_00360 [Candidatus Thorarchaeota archaeon]